MLGIFGQPGINVEVMRKYVVCRNRAAYYTLNGYFERLRALFGDGLISRKCDLEWALQGVHELSQSIFVFL